MSKPLPQALFPMIIGEGRASVEMGVGKRDRSLRNSFSKNAQASRLLG